VGIGTGLVQYSNGGKMSSCRMMYYNRHSKNSFEEVLEAILDFECPSTTGLILEWCLKTIPVFRCFGCYFQLITVFWY
jgi:hypothetical protein